MSAYNLQDKKAVGIVDVQFSPLSTPMVAWYAWLGDDGEEELDKRPVLGVLVRHDVNAEGEVIRSRVELAVQHEDTGELCTANDSELLGYNEAFVGAFPAGVEAPAGSISTSYDMIRARMARKKSG
jgi:hypothetical protein